MAVEVKREIGEGWRPSRGAAAEAGRHPWGEGSIAVGKKGRGAIGAVDNLLGLADLGCDIDCWM